MNDTLELIYQNDAGDKLRAITGSQSKSFTYDLAGNMKTQTDSTGTRVYNWDEEGRLKSVNYPNASVNTFKYNGVRSRVQKVDVASGTRNYLRDGVGVTDPLMHDGNISYTPGLAERFPFSNARRYLHADLIGSLSEVTKEDGNIEFPRAYDAFGVITGSPNSFPRPHGYAFSWTYQEDRDSRLNLVGHRYYDPSLGRFLSRDLDSDGRNWYTYCNNNPLKWADPEGTALHLIVFAVVIILSISTADAPTVDSIGTDFSAETGAMKLEMIGDVVLIGGFLGVAKGGIKGIRAFQGRSYSHATGEARSTYRSRHWRARAKEPGARREFGDANVERMRRGRAPQRYNVKKGRWESKELSHEPTPRSQEGCGIAKGGPTST